jgi:hypothetical protein
MGWDTPPFALAPPPGTGCSHAPQKASDDNINITGADGSYIALPSVSGAPIAPPRADDCYIVPWIVSGCSWI